MDTMLPSPLTQLKTGWPGAYKEALKRYRGSIRTAQVSGRGVRQVALQTVVVTDKLARTGNTESVASVRDNL